MNEDSINLDKLTQSIDYKGAPTKSIQHHYDISNKFYELWLDPTLTYSCALWDTANDLEAAQLKKIDFHIAESKANKAKRVLDIGCGWGSTLKRLKKLYNTEQIVGLTLSSAQVDWVSKNYPEVEVRLENWSEHNPEKPYDAIISVGAFEHFVSLKLSQKEKIEAYRTFFQRCYHWLNSRGQMSIQTIIYENASVKNSNLLLTQDIFPDSNIPHLEEIVLATKKLFEITKLRNDREHYVRTLKVWLKNLRVRRQEAIDLVGEAVVEKYEKYLSLSMIGFHSANLNLSRITLKRINHR